MSSPMRDRSVSRGRSRTPQHSPDRSPARSPHSRGADNSRSRTRSRSHSRSPVRPQSAKIVVEKLTKNVTAAHLREVFSAYGVIADLDLPLNQQFLTNRGIAYILYATPLEAEAAVGCMHEAQVDGACVAVSIVLPRRKWADNVPDKRAAADRFGEPGRYRASGGVAGERIARAQATADDETRLHATAAEVEEEEDTETASMTAPLTVQEVGRAIAHRSAAAALRLPDTHATGLRLLGMLAIARCGGRGVRASRLQGDASAAQYRDGGGATAGAVGVAAGARVTAERLC